MAMEGHARMLEQYADLEEKHIHLLAKHRRIHEGIDYVKKAASTAGVQEFSRHLGVICNSSASLLWNLAAFSIRHQDVSTSAAF
ncbi:hypothetical protein DKX38_010020 [Salix brachista]|uniref:Uncharacterized protein n=1 Tax=Salix brachista TaxID=2182728 RepID=A0A5N5MCF7_9ROSI|nr:hypothetical protein DKX38_010020 [Salix brachista]